MTKYPGYSSATMWHQDIRYWSFDQPELISAWFALGEENERNGALQVIPGSHMASVDRGRFDAALFLRPELPENSALLAMAGNCCAAGPVMYCCFIVGCFTRAARNASSVVKLSPAFTYHHHENRPIPGTRSAEFPSIPLSSPFPLRN